MELKVAELARVAERTECQSCGAALTFELVGGLCTTHCSCSRLLLLKVSAHADSILVPLCCARNHPDADGAAAWCCWRPAARQLMVLSLHIC